tara:strand:- start:2325 stop:2903 length:579 start_codon:yes stop_codon:yes gene_type:complete
MNIEKIEINKLKPATYNPRQISKKQYNDLKDSIVKFDLVDPIILNKDFTVIGGHQRLKVCKELKYKDIDCVVLDLTKEDERELNIRLNKSGGEFDMDILANEFEIEELKDWGFKEIELGLNIDKISNDKNYAGQNPELELEKFMNSEIKRLYLVYDSDTFVKVVEWFNKKIKDLGVENYSDAVLKIIENEKN